MMRITKYLLILSSIFNAMAAVGTLDHDGPISTAILCAVISLVSYLALYEGMERNKVLRRVKRGAKC